MHHKWSRPVDLVYLIETRNWDFLPYLWTKWKKSSSNFLQLHLEIIYLSLLEWRCKENSVTKNLKTLFFNSVSRTEITPWGQKFKLPMKDLLLKWTFKARFRQLTKHLMRREKFVDRNKRKKNSHAKWAFQIKKIMKFRSKSTSR